MFCQIFCHTPDRELLRWIDERPRTVGRVLLHNFHRPCDARFLAVGVIKEGEIALLHGAQVVAGCVGPASC